MAQYTREMVYQNILDHESWLTRAILVLLDRQTPDERQRAETTESNGVGYNRFDAAFMTSLGEQINKGFSLSEKQRIAARRILKKYTGQLCEIANKKGIVERSLFE